MIERRGLLTLIGGALVSPAMAKTSQGIIAPVPQLIHQDELIIENIVTRRITIRNCHIINDDGKAAIVVEWCHLRSPNGAAFYAIGGGHG